MTGLKIRRLPSLRYKFLMTLVAIFALVIQPFYGLVEQIVSAAPNGNQIVRANALGGWNSGSAVSGTTAFVGDAGAPYGSGALELTTTSSNDSRAQRAKTISPNVSLSSVTSLSYWTKYVSGPAHAGAALQITINGLTGSSGSTTLVYEPYWNGTVATNGQWQQWDALAAGKFWSTNTVAGFTNGAGGPPFYTISQVLAMHPNAKITSLKLNIGTYNPNWVVRADGVNLNGTIYDFEPAAPVSQLNGENFNTVNDPYKGVSVGFNAKDFGTVSTVSVALERADGSVVTKTANQGVRDLISNNQASTQVTAPFVIQNGAFTEASDTQYWVPAPAIWTAATTPVKATVTVTDQYGTKTAVINSLSQGAPSWPTYASLLPVSLSVPTNLTPANGTVTKDRGFAMAWGVVPDATKYEYRTANTLVDSTTLGPVIYSDNSSASNYSIAGTTVTRSNNGTPDGDYYWQVRAGDDEGNWSQWSSVSKVTVDNMVPSSTSDLGNLVRSTVTVNQIITDNTKPASGKLRIWKQKADGSLDDTKFYASANVVTVDGANTVTYILNTATQLYGDGKYTAKFTSRDAAGNESVQEKVFTVDNTVPTITVKAGAIGSTTSKIFSNVSFSFYDAYQVDKYVLNGQVVDCTNNNYSDANFQNIKSKLVQGTNTFVLYDVAGNTTTYSFTYDSVAPVAPVHESPVADAVQSSNDFWFNWSDVEDAVSYEMQNSQNPATGTDGSFIHVQWTGDYQSIQPIDSQARSVGADGTWYWQVRAVDAAGNKSAWTSPWKVTIDRDAPGAPTLSVTGLVSGATINASSIVATWNQPSHDTVRYEYAYWNNIPTSAYSSEVNAWTTNLNDLSRQGIFTEGEGTHYLKVRAIDAAGNISPWSNIFVVTYDATAPIVGITSAVYSAAAKQLTVSGETTDASDEVTVKYGSGVFPAIVGSDKKWSVVIPVATSPSGQVVTAFARDTAGNTTTPGATRTVAASAPGVDPSESHSGNNTQNQDGNTTQNPPTATPAVMSSLVTTLPTFIVSATAPTTATVLPSGNVAADAAQQATVLGSETTNGTATAKESETDVKGAADKKVGASWFAVNWWLLLLAVAVASIWWFVIARRRANQEA